MEALSPNAIRILRHFADRNATEGGFIQAPELVRLFTGEGECLAAEAELLKHGMLMLQATASTRACHAALTSSGVAAMGRLAGN